MATEAEIMRGLDGTYTFLTGRKRLVTDIENDASVEEIIDNISSQQGKKQFNYASSSWLWDYARNIQPIMKRIDTSNGASSNNKIMVNFAVAISRILSAYTFPKGINYLSKSDNTDYRDFIVKLNNMMSFKSNNVAMQEMKWYQSVCGHAFLYVNYDKENLHGVPFTIQNVAPWNAFVVYSAFDVYKPVYGCIEYDKKTCVFTDKMTFVINKRTGEVEEDVKLHALGAVPIIEVPNNTMRMGDFETAVTLLDGINSVTSDSVNNVQDVVKSYLVLLGVDPDIVKKGELDFSQGSVIALSSPPGVTQSAQFIHPSLDGITVQQLRSYMDSALKFVTGIPDRDTENSASSTGISEDIRTGQADKDAVANEKTIYVEEAQRRMLEIVFNILNASSSGLVPDGMTAADVDIDITRANRDNILTKSQAMVNFKTIGMSNEDVIYFGNITNDVTGVVERMKETEEANSSDTDDEYFLDSKLKDTKAVNNNDELEPNSEK